MPKPFLVCVCFVHSPLCNRYRLLFSEGELCLANCPVVGGASRPGREKVLGRVIEFTLAEAPSVSEQKFLDVFTRGAREPAQKGSLCVRSVLGEK